MPGKYANSTSVSTEKTRAEIERCLSRYGAESFAYATRGTNAMIGFHHRNRAVRFTLKLPDREDAKFTRTEGRGLQRDPLAAERLWEQACRSSWRSLLLVIKANLEAVEAGIVTFEEAFLPYFVLPDGKTVAEWAEPHMQRIGAVGLPGLPMVD